MEDTVQTHENSQRSEAQGSFMFLQLPDLRDQRSLHSLIEDDLGSHDHVSFEMARLLTQSEEATESETATIEAPGSEVPYEDGIGMGIRHRTNTPGCDESNDNLRTREARSSTELTHVSLWKRLLKRRRATSKRSNSVYRHKRRQILREIIMIHLLPVSANFTLLGLYVRQVLWTPPWPTINVLNALQFASKVHESLMVASLITILLHHIRYRLLSPAHRSSGLPLGLVTSPFRLLDITYVWSWEFLATWRSLEGHRVTDAITIFIHVFFFILVALLGPASAITLLPKLGEWQVASKIANAPFYSTSHRNDIYQVYIGATLSEMFPKNITAGFIPEACDYGNLSLPQTNTCPRIGLMGIVQDMFPSKFDQGLLSTPYNMSSDDRDRLGRDYSITVQREVKLPARDLHVSDPYQLMDVMGNQARDVWDSGFAIDVTTPTDAILYLTELLLEYYLAYWELTVSGPSLWPMTNFYSTGNWPAIFQPYPGDPLNPGETSSNWQRPYVSSACSRSGRDADVSGRTYFTFGQPAPQSSYTVSLDAGYLSVRLNRTGMGFLDVSNLNITPSYTPSAAFAFISQSYTTLCLVKANWVESMILDSYSQNLGSSPDEITWDWTGPKWGLWSTGTSFWDDSRGYTWFFDTENIQLDLDWLAVLDCGTGGQTSNYSFFDKVREVCLGTSALASDDLQDVGQNPDPICMASGLALGITEGLSKVPYKFDVFALGSTEDATYGHPAFPMTMSPWTNQELWMASGTLRLPGNWTLSSTATSQAAGNSTRFEFNVTQNIYGYGFSGITIILAFVVLFLYVVTVFVHILVMVFGTNWNSRAWKSPGEYLVLALHSPVPDTVPDDTGGNVRKSATWRERATVQDLQDGRVGIVLAKQG